MSQITNAENVKESPVACLLQISLERKKGSDNILQSEWQAKF